MNIAVVVSAMGGKPKTTDLLLDSVRAASTRNSELVEEKLNYILYKHDTCLQTLIDQQQLSSDTAETLKTVIRKDVEDIKDILKTVALMKWKELRLRWV